MAQKVTNAYTKLMSDTVIFAIGTFSSKILVFLLLPLYTNVLTKEEYGNVDFFIITANLVLPIVTLSIAQSILRFGLDKDYAKADVFTTALVITVSGMVLTTIIVPILSQTSYISGYGWLFYIYILTSSVKLVFLEFVRARCMLKLYAFSGILTTATMIGFNIIFLIVLKLGITGYILAIILSDFLSIILLFTVAELWKFIKPQAFNKDVARAMLKYSIPLIPTMIMWWITNFVDRAFIKGMMGSSENGLYAAAYKIPSIISSLYTIFNQAWYMSAIKEQDNSNKQRLYKNVFTTNQSFLYMVAATIFVLIVPIVKIMLGAQFRGAIIYIPFLIIATIFSCFSNFMGSIYSVYKKSVNAFFTSMGAAITNVILNLILIPTIGTNGAALATLVSYVVMFSLRVYDTRKFCPFDYKPKKIFLNAFALLIMSLIIIFMPYYTSITLSTVIMALMLIIVYLIICIMNIKALVIAAVKILPKRFHKFIPFKKESLNNANTTY